MSFLDIVERAKAYLERHHRTSLRALRRELDLATEGAPVNAEALIHHALGIGLAQEAKSFEPARATSLQPGAAIE